MILSCPVVSVLTNRPDLALRSCREMLRALGCSQNGGRVYVCRVSAPRHRTRAEISESLQFPTRRAGGIVREHFRAKTFPSLSFTPRSHNLIAAGHAYVRCFLQPRVKPTQCVLRVHHESDWWNAEPCFASNTISVLVIGPIVFWKHSRQQTDGQSAPFWISLRPFWTSATDDCPHVLLAKWEDGGELFGNKKL